MFLLMIFWVIVFLLLLLFIWMMIFLLGVSLDNLFKFVRELIVMGKRVILLFLNFLVEIDNIWGEFIDFWLIKIIRIFLVFGCGGVFLNIFLVWLRVFFRFGVFLGFIIVFMVFLKFCVFLKLFVKLILVLVFCLYVIKEYCVFFVLYLFIIILIVFFMIFNVGLDNEVKIMLRLIFGVIVKKEKERLRIWKNLLCFLENVWCESILVSYFVFSEFWFVCIIVRVFSIYIVGVFVISCGFFWILLIFNMKEKGLF